MREHTADGFGERGPKRRGRRFCLLAGNRISRTAGRAPGRICERGQIKRSEVTLARAGPIAAMHPWGFAEEHIERQVDRSVVKMRILDDEVFLFRRLADDRERAALALAQR